MHGGDGWMHRVQFHIMIMLVLESGNDSNAKNKIKDQTDMYIPS